VRRSLDTERVFTYYCRALSNGCGSGKGQRMPIYRREWKRKDGTKAVRFYYHENIDGVRHRVLIKSAHTMREAKEAVRKIQSEIHDGTYTQPNRKKTFKEFVEEVYIPWAKSNKKSYKVDLGMLKPMIELFGKKRLTQISSFEIEKYKADRRKVVTNGRPRAISTVNKELKLLSKIFKMAKVKNPCDDVKKLKGEVKRTRYLSPEEEERLMAVIKERRSHLWSIIILGLQTGMRRGEILQLRTDQIDFARNLMHIIQIKTGKTLDLPMNATTREQLMELVAEAKANGHVYLFTNPKTGTHYNSVKKAFRSAVKEAGIEDFRFHDLRHTFGTRAVDSGAPLTGVRDALGHASLETTNRYAHGTEDGKRRAVEAQEQYLQRSGHKSVTKIKKQAG
jgi:integrase